MVIVTVSAKEELKKRLLAFTDDPEISLRLLATSEGQLGLLPGKEEEGDEVVEQDRIKVLLIGHELAPILDGMTCDFKDTYDGRRFFIS